MPDDVQPVEGQGTDGDGGIFASYLSAVPEDAREVVAGYLKDAEKNVNERLAEASDLKRTWGPYQQIDLSKYPPEQLSELLAWHGQVTSSDEAYQAWLEQAAKEAGFTKAQAEELESAEETGELSQANIEKLIAEKAAEQVAPLQERFTALEEERTLNQTAEEFRTDLSKLEKEHGEFSEDVVKAIIDLGKDYEGDGSWVQAGWDRLQTLSGDAKRAFVADKTGQPGAALTAGGSEMAKLPRTFDEAGEMFRERLRQAS